MAGEIDRAIDYFSSFRSEEAEVWDSFSPDMQEASVTEAIDILLHKYPDATFVETNTDDDIRWDYALFRQAIYILMLSESVPNGERTAPAWLGVRRNSMLKAGKTKWMICDGAKFYITGRRPRVVLRGS